MTEFNEDPSKIRFSNKGRPTKKEQERRAFVLDYYYEKGVGVNATSKKTGINTRTVSTHFHKRDDDILLLDDYDFLKTCKVEKLRTLQSLDNEILFCSESQKEIQTMIDYVISQGDVILFNKLQNTNLKHRKHMLDLHAHKINLINTSFYDFKPVSDNDVPQPLTTSPSVLPSTNNIVQVVNESVSIFNVDLHFMPIGQHLVP